MKALTAEEMREVDRLTTEQFGIPSLDLMENAGRRTAELTWAKSLVALSETQAVVLCGKGNNGGDGFVIARHLHEKKSAGAQSENARRESVAPPPAINPFHQCSTDLPRSR